jgi:hypothetical protein
MFRLKLTPSFCNNWPEIRITANNKVLWQDFVTEEQVVNVDFDLENKNTVEIEYLNKRSGPDIWDTKLNDQGNIIEDQYCIVSEIYIAKSRCDFLMFNLDFLRTDGTIDENTNGFMSKKGKFVFVFPKDVYKWIVDINNSIALSHIKNKSGFDQESSLAYFEYYVLHNAQDLDPYLSKIDSLLGELNGTNASN